jgi:hypothetical protein
MGVVIINLEAFELVIYSLLDSWNIQKAPIQL